MGKLSSARTRAYLDEFDVSGSINSVDLGLKQVIIPVTCFSDDGPKKIVGNYDHQFAWTGFGDFVAGGFDAQAFNDFRTDEDHYLSTIFGTTEGSPGYDDFVRVMDQVRSGQVDGAQLLNINGEGSGGRSRTTLLRAGVITAGNGTGRNVGVTTLGKVTRVIFRVLAFTGTSVTLKIQGSSDDGAGDAYADIAGLTSGALTAAGVVAVTTTAALEAWRRVVASGTFSNCQVIVTSGVVAGT